MHILINKLYNSKVQLHSKLFFFLMKSGIKVCSTCWHVKFLATFIPLLKDRHAALLKKKEEKGKKHKPKDGRKKLKKNNMEDLS